MPRAAADLGECIEGDGEEVGKDGEKETAGKLNLLTVSMSSLPALYSEAN